MFISPFEVLGVPAVFSLDEGELEKRRGEALGRAISVNEAFRKLRDPISRAESLLSQMGKALPEGQEPKPETALLMQVMEEREALSVARRVADRARIERIASAAKERAAAASERLADAFSEHPPDVDTALRILGELRYLRRLGDEAGSALDEL